MLQLSLSAWIVVFLSVAALDLLIAAASWRRRQLLSNDVTKMMLCALSTSVFYVGSFAFEDYVVSSCFSSLYFIGVDLLLAYMMNFVLKFCELEMTGKLRNIHFLLVWMIFDIAVLLVNPFWEIAIHFVPKDMNGHIIYKYAPHLLYELHLVMCYVMVALVVGILAYRIVQTPSIFVRKYQIVLLVFIADVFLNVLYLVGADYFMLDISVLFYSVAAVMIYHSVFSYIPRSLLNSTRNYIMDNMEAQILVFDYKNRVIDSNQSARKLFPELTPERQNTRKAVDVREYLTEKGFPTLMPGSQEFPWFSRSEEAERKYLCRKHDFLDQKNRVIGWMLLIHDISYQKDTATGLDMTPGLYRYISSLNREVNYPIQVLSVNVNGLGVINSALGHEKGNLVMARTAQIIQAVVGRGVYLAKLENGSIVALLLKTDRDTAHIYAHEIRDTVSRETSLGIRFEVVYGISEVNQECPNILKALSDTEASMKNRKLLSGSSHESPIIHSLTQTLLESDYETEAHVVRTKRASRMLSEVMHLTDTQASSLELLCLLHDVGKVGIPSDILLKPGKLTDEEWEIMKTHTEKGYRIAMTSPDLRGIAEMILHHHERWDGKGYPSGLRGEDIPLLDRIITVLDSFDVMTHDRPYHKAIPLEAAKEELVRCSGTQFDPRVVEYFLKIADRVYADKT